MAALHLWARTLLSARIGRIPYLIGSVLIGSAGGAAMLWVALTHSDLNSLLEEGANPASLDFLTDTGRLLFFAIGAAVSACSLLLTVWRGRDIGLSARWLAAIVVVPWTAAVLLPVGLVGIVMALATVELAYLGLARGRRAGDIATVGAA